MKINYIFYDAEGRLRSGWRIAVYILLLALIGIGAGIPTFAVLSSFADEIPPGSPVFLLITSTVFFTAALGAGWLCGKYLENLPFRALGASFSRGWLRHFTGGILLGSASISFAVTIAYVFGDLRFTLNPASGSAIASSLGIALLVFAFGAAFEEALFRGYIFQTLTRTGLAWLGISLTSVFFLVVHQDNPEAGVISAINTGLAGVWFGIAYLRTRDLWLVWGLHLIWNWMQGAVYGVEVSGLTSIVSAPVFNELDGGPQWLTGGKYGLEGGIAATIAVLASILAIYFLPTKSAPPALESEPPA